jgi:ATP synthase proteolipid subunit
MADTGSSKGSMAFAAHMGVTLAIAISNMGAAYGTAKSGVGITGMGQRRPNLIMKSLIPIVMAGILGIYGMIVSVLLIKNSRVYLRSWLQRDHLVQSIRQSCCWSLLRLFFFGSWLCCRTRR